MNKKESNKDKPFDVISNIDRFLDVLPYSMWIKNTDGVFIYANKQQTISSLKPMHEIIGKRDDEIWGKELGEIFRQEDRVIEKSENMVVDEAEVPRGGVCDVVTRYKMNLCDDNNNKIGLAGFVIGYTLDRGISKIVESMQYRLNAISNMLGYSKDDTISSAFLSSMLADIMNRMSSDAIYISLYDSQAHEFTLHAASGIDDETIKCSNELLLSSEVHNRYNIKRKSLIGMKKVNEIQYETYKEIMSSKGFDYIGNYFIILHEELVGLLWVGYKNKELPFYVQDSFVDNICEEIAIKIKNGLIFNEIKNKIDAIRRREKELRIFFDSCGDLLVEFNHKGEVSILGGQWERILGLDRSEAVEKLFTPERRKTMLETIKKSFNKNKQDLFYEYKVPSKRGEEKVIVWNIGQNKEHKIYTLIGRDVTTEREEEKKNEILQRKMEIEKIKNEFLSHVSKQFEFPIDTIISGIQLLEKEVLDKCEDNQNAISFSRHLSIVKQNAYRLLRLISNLIDMTGINEGAYHLNLSVNNIISVIEDVVLSTIDYVEDKGMSLIFDTDTEERMMAFDQDKLERIILNIISNAIKYSKPNGTIQVRIKNEEAKVIISIKDNGIGIEEEKLKYIFDSFNQADDILTRKREGSGIGLTLVKSLVEMHQGIVHVKSKAGEGSEFIIELPTDLNPDKNVINKMSAYLNTHIQKFNIEFSDI